MPVQPVDGEPTTDKCQPGRQGQAPAERFWNSGPWVGKPPPISSHLSLTSPSTSHLTHGFPCAWVFSTSTIRSSVRHLIGIASKSNLGPANHGQVLFCFPRLPSTPPDFAFWTLTHRSLPCRCGLALVSMPRGPSIGTHIRVKYRCRSHPYNELVS